jgi:NAD+ kinase
VDRGPLSSIVQIQIFTGTSKEPITLVQGDGVIVSTPTGSTAYSLAAGGSMCHPIIPAMLMTPICPHSLSFRSILVPDSSTLRLKVPNDSRNTAWVSFDGRHAFELKQGDSIICRMSEYPVPAIVRSQDEDDWVMMLKTALHWNLRGEQKPFL